MGPFLEAFGLPATVTRPAPDDTPVPSTGFWLPARRDDQPVAATGYQRVDPRRRFVLPRDAALPTLPTGSEVVAPEREGEVAKTWRVDEHDDVADPDCWRVLLKRVM